MKKIALMLTGAFLSVSTVGAMASISDNVVVESKIFDGKKSKVEQSELPQEIIQSLEDGQYQNWEIQEAYKVEDEMTSSVHYELQLASTEDAEMVKSVTFAETGEILSEVDSELGMTEEESAIEEETETTEPALEEEPAFEQETETTDPAFDEGTESTDPSLDNENTEPALDGTEPGTEGSEVPEQQY